MGRNRNGWGRGREDYRNSCVGRAAIPGGGAGRGGAGRAHARTCSVPQRVMSDSTTPWTVAHKAPLSMEFFRQEHWSGPLVKMTNRREARVEGE